jgi:uncharacterized membrane protein YgcG
MLGSEKRTVRKPKFKSVMVVISMVLTSILIFQVSDEVHSFEMDDLVLHYNLDEGGGQNVSDSSGNGWDATLGLDYKEGEKDPEWGEGINGSCLEFDGLEDLIICNPFDMPADEFTIAFWLRSRDKDRELFPLSYAVEGEDNEVLIHFSEIIEVEIDWPNEFEIVKDIRDGSWHHFALTWTGSNGTINCYIDGINEGSGTIASGYSIKGNGSLVFGSEQDSVGNDFEIGQGTMGSLDEIYIFGRELSVSEVMELSSEYRLPVENLMALENDGFVDLSWDTVSDPDLDHYNVYRLDPEHVHNGLSGHYYNNTNLTDLIIRRQDGPVDFNWERNKPIDGVDPETFSVSWKGFLRTDVEGEYDIYTTSDDGVRLWIDGDLIINDWSIHGSTENLGEKYLEKGYHTFRLDYFDETLEADIILEYESSVIPRMVIPRSNLVSIDDVPLTLLGTTEATTIRDSGLTNGESYFYHVTWVDSDGKESPPSFLEGARPGYPSSLSVKPTTMQAVAGSDVTFKIIVTNAGKSSDFFFINISGLPVTWYELPDAPLRLNPGEEKVLELDVSIPVDAPGGRNPFTVTLTANTFDVSVFASGLLEVTTDPEMTGIVPVDYARLGSTRVLFSWETQVSSTTEVYIRKEGETDFQHHMGENGTVHHINISGLERENNFEYYLVSSTDRGSTQTAIRYLFIDSGVVFQYDHLERVINRDYGQLCTVFVENIDDVCHDVTVDFDNFHSDIVMGFTGNYSDGESFSIAPGQRRTLILAVHAQDAMNHSYPVRLELRSTPADGREVTTDNMLLEIKLNHLFVNMTIEEIGVDPYLISKTFRITNDDDPVTDLKVELCHLLKGRADIEPAIDHMRLNSGESIEFTISPKLDFAYLDMSGLIYVSAYDKKYDVPVELELEDGWEIFAGALDPNWNGIPYTVFDPDDIDGDGEPDSTDDDRDGDGIPDDSDPFPDDLDNDGLTNGVDEDDDGDGNPDVSDPWPYDFDNDWIHDQWDPDRDGDGVLNAVDELPDDHDNDGITNGNDTDDDNDLIEDELDYHPQDHDNDGEKDDKDTDDDNDGIEDDTDGNPYDQDNDGEQDQEDGDWKEGKIDPRDPSWNPSPNPGSGAGGGGGYGGGSGGSWGGGGGTDSTEGSNWYCSNKPNLDLGELVCMLASAYDSASKYAGFALTLMTGGLGALAIAVLKDMVQDMIKSAIEKGAGITFAQACKDAVNALAGKLSELFGGSKSGGGFGSSNSGRGAVLRPELSKYYPDFRDNTSKSPSTLIGEEMHFIWQENRTGNTELYYVRSPDWGKNFETEIRLTSANGRSEWPYAAMDEDEGIHLVWVDHRDGHAEIYYKNSLDSGDVWSRDIRITDNSSWVDDPVVLVDENDRVHILWADGRYGRTEILYSYSDDMENWSSPERLTDVEGNVSRPEIELGPDGDFHVVFTDDSDGIGKVYLMSTGNHGGTWTSPILISDPVFEAGEPTITVTMNDTIHIAWRDSRYNKSEIFYRRGPNGGSSWEDEVRMTYDDHYSEYPYLEYFNNSVYIGWMSDITGYDKPYFRGSEHDGTDWGKVKRAIPGNKDIRRAYVELDMKPHGSAEVYPHDFYLYVNGNEVGNLSDFSPDGKYIFEVPLEYLNLADDISSVNSISIDTKHMNRGHYVVNTQWKLTWEYSCDYTFLAAPDQWTADEYLRRNLTDPIILPDPSVYANDLDLSSSKVMENESVTFNARIFNKASRAVKDVTARFYIDGDEENLTYIGDPIHLDEIGPFSKTLISIDWTAMYGFDKIGISVHRNDSGEELDNTNNEAHLAVNVLVESPPSGYFIIDDGTGKTPHPVVTIFLFPAGMNKVTHYRISTDNETWSSWEWITSALSYTLPIPDSLTRSSGEVSVLVQYKDEADLTSEVISREVEMFLEKPMVENWIAPQDDVSPLKITFNNPMNEDSVRANFNITPSIDGSFRWENGSLLFEPLSNWNPETRYMVNVSSECMDIWRRTMDVNFIRNFTISGSTSDDTDGDGMPDAWEDLHGLNKSDPSDAAQDLDGDGISNLDEYKGGTDPEIFDDPVDDDDDDDDDDANDDDGFLGNSSGILCCLVPAAVIILIALVVIIVIVRKGGRKDGFEE